ncbi:DedA family protein [Candidatus Kuenenbacteria bacterium]|nr:DedA family protein [Candidatus Kuenenbacteria bacterium]
MEEFLTNIYHYINYLPLKGYGVIFLFSFLEAFAFVGILFPGTIIIVLIGLLSYLGHFNIALAFAAAVLGALAGDLGSYYLGKKKGLDLKLGDKGIFKFLYMPEAGEFLLEGGGISIITGRFIGPTRAFVPFYMGAAGEKEKKFIIYDVVGVLVWAAFYLMLGYVFGNSYEFVKQFISGLQFFVILFIVLTVGSLVLTKLFKKKLPDSGKK